MNKQCRGLLSATILCLLASVGAAEPLPKALSEIPLAKCTAKEALGIVDIQSVEREGANAKQSLHQNEQLEQLMATIPKGKPGQPIGELMTAEQTGRFTELSTQMLIHQLNHLAESRLQRDVLIMGAAVDALDNIKAGAPTLKTKIDPDGDGAGLIGLLRRVEEKQNSNVTIPANPGVCSVDLAMYRKEQVSVAAVNKLLQSSEMREWNDLRSKYKITGPLDPNKLPSPDKEKGEWLTKAVAEPATREIQAVADWEDLRFFTAATMIEYSAFRDDIITGAGAKDYDYDTATKKAYDAANSGTRLAMGVWNVIDKSIPDEATKEAVERNKMIQDSQRQPH